MIFLCCKKLKFNLDITGTAITSPVNISSTSNKNVIWSPNYPNSYDGNYDQVSHDSLYFLYHYDFGIGILYIHILITGVDTSDY